MSYADAMNILDRRREGEAMPVTVVNKALELTGDLGEDVVQVAIAELSQRTA